ncbi:MAG: amino acid-binding protein [Armatimonadetes bacterium]|nr:amino acid-binding protein [Armatimonadota bacterium]
MKIQQLSVFLENRPGSAYSAAQAIAEAGVNIRALAIAETAEFGILRMIVDRLEAAYEALRDAGFAVVRTDVLAIEVADSPGGLLGVLKSLNKNGTNGEYLYALPEKRGEKAILILRVEDPETVTQELLFDGHRLLSQEELLKTVP